MGSIQPWVESICLYHGAAQIYTVRYFLHIYSKILLDTYSKCLFNIYT